MAQIYKWELGKTNYNDGSFNFSVDVDRYVRKDGGPVVLLLGQKKTRVEAKVTRNANNNRTARVQPRAALRNWFQDNFKLKDEVEVRIMSPQEFWLLKPKRRTGL